MDKLQYNIDETLQGVRIDKAISTLNEEWFGRMYSSGLRINMF